MDHGPVARQQLPAVVVLNCRKLPILGSDPHELQQNFISVSSVRPSPLELHSHHGVLMEQMGKM